MHFLIYFIKFKPQYTSLYTLVAYTVNRLNLQSIVIKALFKKGDEVLWTELP